MIFRFSHKIIVCPCYPYDMNCTCNATDSWGKPILTGWIWYTYASQLCIAHKPIEANPLEASLDYAGGDQPA